MARRRTTLPRALTVTIAVVALAALAGTTAASAATPPTPLNALTAASYASAHAKPRTVVTTDGEQDDVDSMIRYLAYADDFDTVGLVYTASVWHWAGDGKGTPFMSPDPHGQYTTPQTTWRWTGTQWLQQLIGAYGQEYRNLRTHDPNYPSPASLADVVAVGNIDFEGEMDHDTAGSNLIKKLLLDNVPGPLYLQLWGGMNTVARALKSIQDEYQGSPQWQRIYAKVSAKAVIEASGFQDDTYTDYVASVWPRIQVNDLATGYNVWGYPRSNNTLPQDQVYYSGAWMKANVVDAGPLGAQEYTYGDGRWNGDPLYTQWKGTAQPEYTFVSEGDDVAFLPLVDTGLDSANPTYGGWGGRLRQVSASPDLYTNVPSDTYPDGSQLAYYDWSRWFQTAQLDFAARLQWGITPKSCDTESEPVVRVLTGDTVSIRPGGTVQLRGLAYDADGRALAVQWWQYRDAGTYPGTVSIQSPASFDTAVTVPADARAGQSIHVILQVTENGPHALTRYQRVVITVR